MQTVTDWIRNLCLYFCEVDSRVIVFNA